MTKNKIPKKIGIFCGYYLPHLGGVERYVSKLSEGLKKLGYEIVIVTTRHEDSLLSYEVTDGVAIYRLPIRSLAKSRYPIPHTNTEYKLLIKRIEDEGIDYFIVNTRFHLTSLVGARMGRRLGSPVMLIEHGTYHFTVGQPVLDFFGKIYEHFLTFFIKRYVDKFYGVSKKCNDWLKHFSIQASGVFYNAIDINDQNGVKDYYAKKYKKDELVISYAGRLLKEKGVLNLLDAFMQVKQKHPKANLRLAIAGDGELYDKIRETYNDSSVSLLGRLDFAHVMSLYKRSDIFVYPTLYPEGLPTSILEAGLMQCAVIATPKGGTEEVITDHQHGIIVGGSTESLCSAIEELVTDSQLREKLAQNIQTRVQDDFNWELVSKQVDKEIKIFKVKH